MTTDNTICLLWKNSRNKLLSEVNDWLCIAFHKCAEE